MDICNLLGLLYASASGAAVLAVSEGLISREREASVPWRGGDARQRLSVVCLLRGASLQLASGCVSHKLSPPIREQKKHSVDSESQALKAPVLKVPSTMYTVPPHHQYRYFHCTASDCVILSVGGNREFLNIHSAYNRLLKHRETYCILYTTTLNIDAALCARTDLMTLCRPAVTD